MTDILAWLIANWLIVAIAATLLILAGAIRAFSWYMRRLVTHLLHEILDEAATDPWTDDLLMGLHGDVPHVPEKAKRRAA